MVVDTGVLISAFVFGGTPEKAVKKALAQADICVSPALLNEYKNVPLELETRGKITRPQMESLIAGIAASVAKAKIVFPRKRLNLCRDAKDNMVLECCIEARANLLVTGDKDLLDLKNLPFNLKVITPSEYVHKRKDM